MVRSVLGFGVSVIVWWAGFYALVYLLAMLWPDFALHGRIYQRDRAFTFTAPMACFLVLFWALAEIGAGWVAMKIAKRRETVWALAGFLAICIAAVHMGARHKSENSGATACALAERPSETLAF